MDELAAVKQEVLQRNTEEEEVPMNTDDEEASLDLDEEELHLQLQILQNRRRRLHAKCRQRKRLAQSTTPSTTGSTSTTSGYRPTSMRSFQSQPQTVPIDLLSDDDEPQVKVEADHGSELRPESSLGSTVPAQDDTTITSVTSDLSEERSARFQSGVSPQRSIPSHTSRSTPIESGSKHQAAEQRASPPQKARNLTASAPRSQPQIHDPGKVVKNPKIVLRATRPSKKTPVRTPATTSRQGQKERKTTPKIMMAKSPTTPKKRRLTKDEQLIQEAEELLESNPPSDTYPQGVRARPPVGTYRFGLTPQDTQPLLARFCVRTLEQICTRLHEERRLVTYPDVPALYSASHDSGYAPQNIHPYRGLPMRSFVL
ncbi:hypothetical protein LTR10_020777 [Elasticomyces elasticus]|uniref:Uncharacterized protein n=1 Tax=Exophiala sideris TaxID=1016849 RepID=A0ABR0J7Y5_9EURO|nr:hypothetical protein LTR10_020777 [Elasticomyces elasticus]KAK5028838.1 hypothetical protein LTS07_006218 [Exophiala sideris]KAK5035707.1 hypothetical protein LTR13_005837 [Exophiala sideris]KAK5057342.1 hypothetical protein LTR69_007382 [Exophiala sideris]KAK5181685.1 hypothetical protein LTR44_005884 [Eurotiomycetes sp. CCFEE 6388]